MSKKVITIFLTIGVFILLAGSGYFIVKKMQPEKEVHYHAGFQVYVDDVVQDFSKIDYMTIAPCREHKETEQSESEEQNDKGHLHDNIGDVVHVHHEGGTWEDLFTNIHYTFPKDKPVFAFINGTSIEDIFHTPIKAYDRVVIFVGKRDHMKENLKKAVTIEHIKEVEKKSELCGSGKR